MGTVYKRNDTKVPRWIQYTDHGRRRRIEGGQTKAHAKALLAKIETELWNETLFPDKKRTDLTIEGLRDLWLQQKTEKKSLRSDRLRFDAIVEHFGARPRIVSLSRSDVEGFKAALSPRVCESRSRVLGPPREVGRLAGRPTPARSFVVVSSNEGWLDSQGGSGRQGRRWRALGIIGRSQGV